MLDNSPIDIFSVSMPVFTHFYNPDENKAINIIKHHSIFIVKVDKNLLPCRENQFGTDMYS
jgi:hypothetical protein